MVFPLISLIGFVAFKVCVAQELTLPVNICQRNSTDTCLKDAIQEAWPKFVQGLPEFNFPTLDPLLFERHHASYDAGDIHAEIDAINITMTGLTDSRILLAKTQFAHDVSQLEIELEASTLSNDGNVKIVGNIGPFTLNQTGQFNINVKDTKIRWIITGHVADDRWIIERFRAIPIIKIMIFSLSGEQGTEEFMNLLQEFANEYWPIMYRAIGRKIIDTWEPWHIDIANRLFSKISFSKLFP